MARHEDFMLDFFDYVYPEEGIEPKYGEAEIEWAPYGEGRRALICPEPLTFIERFEGCSSDREACIQVFKEVLRSPAARIIALDHRPQGEGEWDPGYWFNTTKSGINLRPGKSETTDMPTPVVMGDESVHGLMAGQTGSGKSALLNCIICNLLAEYPPWELDLYLADFKKVEFSRYMNRFPAPHVSACAATGEVRYVVSLIQHLVDCMDARERLFSCLGVQKIGDLRDSKALLEVQDALGVDEIVLPRMLLIVDEFQQMFLDASRREATQIADMLTAIAKKGRATGLHILFASQDTRGTLPGNVLGNFRIRFALNCCKDLSMDIVGSLRAMGLPRGKAVCGASDDPAGSVVYQVPYVETSVGFGEELSYFDAFLERTARFAEQFGFSKAQKFYQEDVQRPFSEADAAATPSELALEEILRRIRPYRLELHKEGKYFEVLTLGDYVTYSNLRFDIQTLFLEYGRNKNILVASSRIDDLAYMEKLLCCNFATSPRSEATGIDYEHLFYSLQPGVSELFSPTAALQGACREFKSVDELDRLKVKIEGRKTLMRLCRECETPFEFATAYASFQESQLREVLGYQPEPMDCHELEGVSLEGARAVARNIARNPESSERERILAAVLRTFVDYKHSPRGAFAPCIIWLVGIDSVERVPAWLLAEMRAASDYDLLFVVMTTSRSDDLRQMASCFDYFFLGGTDRRLYEALGVDYTARASDSIVLDLLIRSAGEMRSFKKYRCGLDRPSVPSVPFDDILGLDSR